MPPKLLVTANERVYSYRLDKPETDGTDNARVMIALDITLRDYARLEAKRAGMTLSKFVARAVQQAVAKASADRAISDAEQVEP